MSNLKEQIVNLLRELAELTLLDEANSQSFRVRAYENAAFELKAVAGDLSEMSATQLSKLRGIGKSTAQKIREYIDTGKIDKLEKLRAKYPPDFVELSHIPGLGPKTLQRLRAELSIENIADLKAAIAAEKIRELPRLGKKSEEKIAKAIERMGLTGKNRRIPIARALPIANQLVSMLEEMPGVERAQYCGSLRRFRETIGDIDIVVSSTNAGPIMSAIVEWPLVAEVLVHGDTKTSIVTDTGIQVDIRVVEPDQYGAAALYFTGSKAHNIRLRQRALARGWTLNEYSLSDAETGDIIASKTEQDVYRALEVEWIPPPMREDGGEIEAGAGDGLPQLLTESDLMGDLHVHTTRSGDGKSPLEDMLAIAAKRGYSYIAITDHGENLAINGVSREGLLEQREQMRALAETYPNMTLLHGCELNIAPDGSLDYDDEFRRTFDWCVAAVHSHFDLPQAEQTKRILTAMQDPSVNVIGHLTGRMIGRRPGIEIDVDAVLEAAAETHTAIELNSSLSRLDAAAHVLRRGQKLGVTFVVSTDAHHVDEMERMRWGALHAQRGWLETASVANTWDRKRFLAWTREARQS